MIIKSQSFVIACSKTFLVIDNATKTLLPGLFSEIKNVLYTPKQDYSLGVDNKINKLNVDNKNERVSFVKENRVVPNLMNAKSEDVGTFVNMRPYA